MKLNSARRAVCAGLTALTLSCPVRAAEIGHYAGGVMNIRDYVVPDPGFYLAVYNYFYHTTRLNDANGNKISSITINPGGGPGLTLGVNIDVNVYALAPSPIWVTEIKSLGLKYGAFIAPTLSTSSLATTISTATGRGGTIHGGGVIGFGDLQVQPIWLGKTTDHWDLAFGYSFYAPVGKYATNTITLPVVGPITTEPSSNIGLGFWTNQFQGAVTWYPVKDKSTAIATAVTYEINGRKRGFDLTPGDNLTFNWGVSQFLPLKKDGSLLLEVGPAGYDTWQVTSDSGRAANKTKDQVHAAGGQIGLTYIPWAASLNFRGLYEYSAKDRTQGTSLGLNFGIKF